MPKKLFGIDIPDELEKSNYYALFLSTALVMLVYMIPTIVLPRFLKEIIGVPEKSFGEINSAIQNIGTVTSILPFTLVGAAELITFLYVISKWKQVPKITRDTKISH